MVWCKLDLGSSKNSGGGGGGGSSDGSGIRLPRAAINTADWESKEVFNWDYREHGNKGFTLRNAKGS